MWTPDHLDLRILRAFASPGSFQRDVPIPSVHVAAGLKVDGRSAHRGRFPERLYELWTPDDLGIRMISAHNDGSILKVENTKLEGCIFRDGAEHGEGAIPRREVTGHHGGGE